MASKARTPGPLVAAAAALEAELEAFEQVAKTALHGNLASERNLDKATQALNEAAAIQNRIGASIGELMKAINDASLRNRATADALVERKAEIEGKGDERLGLLRRFEEIGKRAGSISSEVRNLPEETAARRESLQRIADQMGAIVDDARALQESAQGIGATDIAQQADSLRQQVYAARNKLSLAQRKLDGN